MFLIGGPAYSGTTLLTHILNQGTVTCLHEPDFHNPEKGRKGLLQLRELFPSKTFPDTPGRELTYGEAVDLIQDYEKVIIPQNLGFKTCNRQFVEYAKIYKQRGYPVIAIIRDIRDALVTPLPSFINGEKGLNQRYRLVWKNLHLSDLWFRYEDLVMNTQEMIDKISKVLSYDFKVMTAWDPESVNRHMLWEKRHHLLKQGHISKNRLGIWKTSGQTFSEESHDTAKMMGY